MPLKPARLENLQVMKKKEKEKSNEDEHEGEIKEP